MLYGQGTFKSVEPGGLHIDVGKREFGKTRTWTVTAVRIGLHNAVDEKTKKEDKPTNSSPYGIVKPKEEILLLLYFV